jgi:hypothetical protein
VAGKIISGASGTAANASYPALDLPFAAQPGGARSTRTLFASATVWGSATIYVYGSPDGLGISDGGWDKNAPTNANSRWFLLSSGEGGTITANGYYNVVTTLRKIYAVVSGGTSTTSNIVLELV